MQRPTSATWALNSVKSPRSAALPCPTNHRLGIRFRAGPRIRMVTGALPTPARWHSSLIRNSSRTFRAHGATCSRVPTACPWAPWVLPLRPTTPCSRRPLLSVEMKRISIRPMTSLPRSQSRDACRWSIRWWRILKRAKWKSACCGTSMRSTIAIRLIATASRL